MAVQHRTLPVYGVQFHPESIATESGRDLLKNFINLAGSRCWSPSAPAAASSATRGGVPPGGIA